MFRVMKHKHPSFIAQLLSPCIPDVKTVLLGQSAAVWCQVMQC